MGRIAKAVIETVESVGITIKKAEESIRNRRYAWDGEGLVAYRSTDVLHEVAHYQLCGEDRRGVPEYGLGANPDTGEGDLTTTVKESSKEEVYASLLGILWKRKLGLDWKETLEYHSWEGYESVAEALDMSQELKKLGYLDENLHPTTRVGKLPILEELKSLQESIS